MLYPLYSTFANLWPMLAPLESYEPEMAEWCQMLGETEPDSVLDLGSGGGHHLYHLLNQMPSIQEVVSVDLSQSMLERVKELVPRAECHCRDMTEIDLGRKFPLVTVHDSFCYLTEVGQVEALFSVVAAHLAPGGTALVKVDAVADSFEGPYRYLTDFEGDDFDLTLTHYEWDPDPNDTELEVVYLFLERQGAELQVREERHRLGLFSKQELLRAAEMAGFQVEFEEHERWDEERENLLLILRNDRGS